MIIDDENINSIDPEEGVETEETPVVQEESSEEMVASVPEDSETVAAPELESEPEEVFEEQVAEVLGEDASESDDSADETFAPVVSGASDAQQKWPGQWYVLHTYSGYEDAVADSLKQRISSLDMQDKIFDVMVPKENQIEIKNGKRKTVEKKMFPGYVLVNMNVTEDSWYVVRNTPNVTGFIGSGTVPVPIAESELKGIFKRMEIEEPKYKIDLSLGDLVNIKDGPFKNYDGAVSEIDDEKGKIKVLVSIFGRETPVELDFLQVKKV